ADVVVVASRSASFGLVALEAAACGVPVVASAVGGLQSLVDHGETGFLVPDRDPRAFARAIERILDDPLLAASMSVASAERASRYTWGFARSADATDIDAASSGSRSEEHTSELQSRENLE